MSQVKNGLRAFALCALAALGLMAFFAAGAQAEPGAAWMVAGANIPSTLKVEIEAEIEPLGIKKEVHVVLLITIGKQLVEILCGKVVVKEGVLEIEGKDKGILEFTACETFLEGKLSEVCKPSEPIVAKVLSLIVLHVLKNAEGKEIGKDDVVEFFPHKNKEGKFEPFTTMHFSELCTLEVNEGAGVPITGKIWAKDCNKLFLVEEVTHLIEEDKEITKALGGLFFGVNPATLDGSVNLRLVGIHKGLKWSGLWK